MQQLVNPALTGSLIKNKLKTSAATLEAVEKEDQHAPRIIGKIQKGIATDTAKVEIAKL